jgi:hypothetical protein
MLPTNLEKPIPLSTIEANLTHYLSNREARYIMRQEGWKDPLSRNQQIALLSDLVFQLMGEEISLRTLGYIFNISHGTVQHALSSVKNGPVKPNRPTALTNSEEQLVIQHIELLFSDNIPLRPTELLAWVNTQWNLTLSIGWVYFFITRHSDSVMQTTGSLQEAPRLTVPYVFLEQHLELLRSVCEGKYADLVFNLDEAGCGDYEDRSDFQTIVPKRFATKVIHYPVERKFGHSTILACIAASGDSLTPLIIAPPADDAQIWALGYRPNEDFSIRHAKQCYVTKEIFLEYINDIFIPYVSNLHSMEEYAHETAILLMDNLSSHCTPDVLQLLAQHRILAITFPPHTSHLFQPLDLCFFSVLKSHKTTLKPQLPRNSPEGQILAMIESYESTATGRVIRSSFQLAGIVPLLGPSKLMIRFSEGEIQKRDDFREAIARHTEISEISERRQRTKFGIMNQEWVLS